MSSLTYTTPGASSSSSAASSTVGRGSSSGPGATPGRSAAADAQLIQSRLKPLLPSKYHFELRLPVVFVCTRIGEIGSALFTSTTATDDKDVTLTASESRGLVDFVHNPDFSQFITASGRKFVMCSQQAGWFHGRCISSKRHRGGIIISCFEGGVILVCVYEKPMTVFDAMAVVSNIKNVLGDHVPVIDRNY